MVWHAGAGAGRCVLKCAKEEQKYSLADASDGRARVQVKLTGA